MDLLGYWDTGSSCFFQVLPGILQEEPILQLSVTMAAPSSMYVSMGNLWLLLPFKGPLLPDASPAPKALNSMAMRPPLSPGLFGERCRHCGIPVLEATSHPKSAGLQGKEHLHHPGKHQPFQSRSFLKQKENILQFQFLVWDKLCPNPPDHKLL